MHTDMWSIKTEYITGISAGWDAGRLQMLADPVSDTTRVRHTKKCPNPQSVEACTAPCLAGRING